jgi:hypothetical protein
VRTASTDANGVYRIENLRPGTYALTFTLSGLRPSSGKASSSRRTSPRRSTPT